MSVIDYAGVGYNNFNSAADILAAATRLTGYTASTAAASTQHAPPCNGHQPARFVLFQLKDLYCSNSAKITQSAAIHSKNIPDIKKPPCS